MIEGLLEQIATGGWGELDNVGKNFSKLAREQGQADRKETDRQAEIIAKALGTKNGKALLDLLVRMTVLRQPGEDEFAAATVEQYALLKAHRAGQNSIVFMLLARLQQFHGKPKSTGGENETQIPTS